MPPPAMDQTRDAPQYNVIGTQYDVIKTTMFARLEHVKMQQAVEPLLRAEGDKVAVIDWGCGTGFYSQRLLGWGAASVTGVDVSSAMFRSVSLNLKPAGVFVGVCYDATDDLAACTDQPVMRRVGVKLEYPEALDNGLGYRVHVFGSPPPGSDASIRGVDFWTYHLKKSVFEEAARAGGMRGKLEWHNCAFAGDEWRRELGLDGDDEGWRLLRERPQLSVLVLRKT